MVFLYRLRHTFSVQADFMETGAVRYISLVSGITIKKILVKSVIQGKSQPKVLGLAFRVINLSSKAIEC